MNNNKNKQLTLNKKRLILFSFLLFFNFFSNLGFSQTPPEIVLSWNINVGCQVYSPPKEREISAEDIGQSPCIRVCENSKVIYTLTGALGTNPNVQWIAAGGTASAPTNTATTSSTQVTWGASGTGSISFTMNTASGGTITKTLCIEIIKRPQALYSAFPIDENAETTVCVGQPIIFTDLSSANGGTAIVTHYWNFGDDTFSAAQNPTHTYSEEGTKSVFLTVTNACGCSTTFKRDVVVNPKNGFEISCPSVVCDSQTSTYNLPFGGEQVCSEYHFTADGGTITDNPNNGSVTVAWDHVGASGFGFLTFNPDGNCNLECALPTTIKIPVIQTIGTIQGNAIMCLGSQERYKLPQWPATNFQWEILDNVSNSLAIVIPTDQSNEIIIQPTQSGTITLVCTYQNTLLHCGGSATFTIQVNSPEPVTGPSNLCINSTGSYHTISNQAVNWTLVKNGIVVNTLSNNSNYNYTFASAGNYSLTVSGPNVCGNQTTSITVNPIPVAPLIANITAPTALICPVAPYTYSVTVPNPNMDYSWAITGGSIAGSSTDTEVTVSFNQTGPYTLQLTQHIKGQSSCVSPPLTITPNVFVIQADLSNSATALNPALGSCANLASTYYAVNSVGAGLYTLGETYTWSISPSSLGSITSGQGTNTVAVLWNNTSVAATAHLILQITKCTRTTVIDRTVAITPLPNLTLSATNTCSGVFSTMTLSSSNGVPFAAGTVINWNYGNGETSVQTISSATSAPITNYHNYFTAPTGNVSYTITASIVNPNGCAGTVTKTTNVTITPGPLATASIQSGGNFFCIPSPITTVLQAATSGGATIKWYKTSSGTVLGTVGTYSPTSAGTYYFIATLNGCSTYSNNISVIVQNCSPPPTCTLSPVPAISVAQTMSLDCGNLSLAATASAVPLASNWTIVGPDPDADALEQPGSDLYHYSTPITAAGTYHVVYKAKYTCTDGSTGFLPTNADITVPYIATFTTAVTCNGSSFDIALANTSSFITSVGSRRYFYYVSNNPGGPWTAVNTLSAATTTYTAAAGTYYFKLVIDGIQQGASTYSPVCEKVSDAIVLAPDPVQYIQPSGNTCYNSAVGFSISGQLIQNETYLWTFDTQSTNFPLAQNTQPAPYRVFDPIPSGAAHPVTVTVVITNKYGCTRTLSTTITIPARCYFGDIVTTTPSICKNGSMVLQYQPNAIQADNCAVSQYQWMEGSNPTPIATTTIPSYTVPVVTGTPFYWIRLINASGCVYNGTTRLTPAFLPLPTAHIAAPGIVCQSSSASATITTNATSFYWYVDNVQQTAYNSISSLPLNNFALGNHVLSLTAFGTNGCNKTVTQNFTVKASPNAPTVSYSVVDCSNYKIQLIATPPAGGTGTLTWSSGTPGNPTTVHSGGPYMVTYNDGSGCVSTAQLDVPYSLDKYMWVFPSGCYTMCDTNLGTLIGPDVLVSEWQWLYENNSESSGAGFVDPYQPTQTGVYNLSLNSACPQVSAPMNVTINQCEKCPFIVESRGVECIQEKLYTYALSLIIDNMSGDIINTTITVPGDEVIIAPAAIAVEPGANTYNFTLIPINGFAGGTVTFILSGIDPHTGKACTYDIHIELQDCMAAKTTDKKDLGLAESNANSLLLYPNPTQGAVNVQFECQSNDAVIAVYDLTGKQLAAYDAKNKKGTVNVALTHFASGIYVVVLKENGQITMQKKLVIE